MSRDEKRSDEAEWGRLADAATPGPWHIEESVWDIPGSREVDRIVCGPKPQGVPRDGIAEVFDGHWVSGEEEPGPAPNLHFIAAARTAVPSLLAALAAAREDNERLRADEREAGRYFHLAEKDLTRLRAERDAALVEVTQLQARIEALLTAWRQMDATTPGRQMDYGWAIVCVESILAEPLGSTPERSEGCPCGDTSEHGPHE